MMTLTLSLALIVRDAEITLARCLDSVRPYVDELVVVDTGSQDATRAIARQFTDRIFDFAWRDDFSAARQFAFDQATGDWIAWVDADDVLIGGDLWRAEMAALPTEITCVHWRYLYVGPTDGAITSQHWREHCIRNDGSYRWQGRVHEVLVRDRAEQIHYSTLVWLEHHQQPRQARSRRNLNILEAEYRELGEATPARSLFYLGNEYVDHQAWQQAADCYGKYLQRGSWRDERYFAAVRRARALWALADHDAALDAYLSALKELPAFPHAYFGLAEVYYTLHEWDKVIHWIELGQKMPPPHTTLFLNTDDYTYHWIIHYTNALYHMQRMEEALEWTERALSMHPDDPYHTANRAFFLSQLGASSSSPGDESRDRA